MAMLRLSLLLFFASLASCLTIPTPKGNLPTSKIQGRAPWEPKDNLTCADIHIISARGSRQLPGEGTIGVWAQQIQDELEQSVSRDVVTYPASLWDYSGSVTTGTRELQKMIRKQVVPCPNQRLVLLGYSQGAQVVGDALVGCEGDAVQNEGELTPAIEVHIGDHVAAIVIAGDPRRTMDESYHKGTSSGLGLILRTNTQNLDVYAIRMQSYCDEGDLVCDTTHARILSGLKPHWSYMIKYHEDAYDFIKERIVASYLPGDAINPWNATLTTHSHLD